MENSKKKIFVGFIPIEFSHKSLDSINGTQFKLISSQKVGVRKHLLHSVGIENNVFLNSFLTDHSYDSTRSDCPVPLSVG